MVRGNYCVDLRVEQLDPNMPDNAVAVVFRALRDEPRFQEFLRRMNLPLS
jgi:hypothetical protein